MRPTTGSELDSPAMERQGKALLDFPEHLVNPNQRRVHHLFPGANLHRRHRVVGAVATLGRGFNGREILVVAVAVAEKEKLFHSCPLLQRIAWLQKNSPETPTSAMSPFIRATVSLGRTPSAYSSA